MSSVFPIGPYHPALKEPEYFVVEVIGEKVVDIKMKVGYNHRGIEKIATTRNYHRNVFLLERVCGICSVAHTLCYTQAVERLFNIGVPDRAKFIRTIMAELNRIHSHLLWLGIAMHLIGFDTLFMHAWREREHVMELIEIISGNRVNAAINTIGGVRRDTTAEKAHAILKRLEFIERGMRCLADAIKEDPLIKLRVKEIGILAKEDAMKLCVVGPTLRGSGIESDVRKEDPYAAYGDVEFDLCVEDGCDVLARLLVRVKEAFESIRIVRGALKGLPDGQVATKEFGGTYPNECLSRVEAPRGELIYYIRSNETNIPESIKIRTPSFANLPSITFMGIGANLADIPIIIGSIDPCFSCTDRLAVVDLRSNAYKVYTFEDLARGRHR